jgi:inosine-uridine nucleoside N-ribohydrolase
MTDPARIPVIVDCDPGHDDAMAILLAAEHLDLVGLTTVFGNQTVENTTRNALALCRLAKLDVPVARGASGPIDGAEFYGSDMHGRSGFDGAVLPDPDRAAIGIDAVAFMKAEIESASSPISLIAIGPLTNVALLIRRHPATATKIRAISVMGGTTAVGNVTPVAENNIFADPEAAAIVFDSGIPLYMAGLNVTTTVGAGEADILLLRAMNGPISTVAAGLLEFYRQRQLAVYGRTIAPFHDPCAVIPFIRPGLIEYRDAHVAVELDGRLTRGMTVCDFRGVSAGGLRHVRTSGAANVRVAIAATARPIIDLVIDAISKRDGLR